MLKNKITILNLGTVHDRFINFLINTNFFGTVKPVPKIIIGNGREPPQIICGKAFRKFQN